MGSNFRRIKMEDKSAKSKAKEVFNPLRNSTVEVRFVPNQNYFVKDPKSPVSGGLGETSVRTYAVPMENGSIKAILTRDEEEFFEKIFGYPDGFMSANKVVDNYWSTYGEGFINRVQLNKLGKKLDLSKPKDYIEWKILKANNLYICPSLDELENHYKMTYSYVLVEENDMLQHSNIKADTKYELYTIYGEFMNDADALRGIIKLIEHKALSPNTKLEVLKANVISLIDNKTRAAADVLTSKNLKQKLVLLTAVAKGIVVERNGFYYLKENGQKLCEDHEDPNLNTAANYLADIANNELYVNLQKKIAK